MADIAPAQSDMVVCQASRISGSAAMAEISLCHRVIQSCASFLGSGNGWARDWPGASGRSAPASHPPESRPLSSRPASIVMPHSYP